MIPVAITILAIAAIALAIGFVAGSQRATVLRSVSATDEQMLNSSRLRGLVCQMGLNVDEHKARVEQLLAEVKAMNPGGTGEVENDFVNSIYQIAEANERLQRRLEKAELELQVQEEKARAHQCEAHTDALTQIPNRRAFDGEIKRRSSEWQRIQTPFSLIIFDIDHFKRFNDTHGHLAGDEVLKQVAAALRASTREMDLLCRYGGEEFAIVLPATTAAHAVQIAERLRRTVEAHLVHWEGKKLQITCSGGVADIVSAGTSIQLVKRADEALYQSKQAGRNCTHLFDGLENVPVTPGKVIPVQPAERATQFKDRMERGDFPSDRRRSEASRLTD